MALLNSRSPCAEFVGWQPARPAAPLSVRGRVEVPDVAGRFTRARTKHQNGQLPTQASPIRSCYCRVKDERMMIATVTLLVLAMTSLTAHAQQPPYGVQFFYAQPHYNNFAHARDLGPPSPGRDALRMIRLPAPPLEAPDVRAARLEHLAAHDAAQARRARRDTFVAVRPVLAQGAQFAQPAPLEGRLAAELRMPSVSQQAVARGALPVAAVHDQQTRGNEALTPVHLHRAALPPTHSADNSDTLRTDTVRLAAQQSLSARAQLFGAVPVAAVHDQQTAPHQWRGNHQTRPLYIERFE